MYHVSEQLVNELIETIREELSPKDAKALNALHYLRDILIKQSTCSSQVSQTVAAAYTPILADVSPGLLPSYANRR